MTKPKKPMKDCCVAMTLVLGRARPKDQLGLMRETLFSFSGKPPRDIIVIRMNKAPRGDKSEHALARFIEVSYCPFCGKRVRRRRG